MHATSTYRDIVSGRAGLWSEPVRWLLSAASMGYGWAVSHRNRSFDSGKRPTIKLPVPVISVGNITTGGTGKTPLVIDLIERLKRRGRRPAVVARGYRSRRGETPDELKVVSRNVTDVNCFADPDRVRAARRAVADGADVIVMDDGFQHRRLGRDLNIVVIDATNPFGFDHVLPRGTLREPAAQLKRADLIVISRADMIPTADLETLESRLCSYAPGRKVVTCRHRPAGLTDLTGRPYEGDYKRAILFAGIGNPEAFAQTVRQIGIEPVRCLWWPDHHHYVVDDFARLSRATRSVEHDVMLTTQKDAVKLKEIPLNGLAPLRVVEINIEFLENAEATIEAALDTLHLASDPQ